MCIKANVKQYDIKRLVAVCLTNFNKKYLQFGWYSIQLDIVHQKQGCVWGFYLYNGQNLLSMTSYLSIVI